MRTILWLGLLLLPAALSAQLPTPVEQPRTLNVNAIGSIEREPEQGIIILAVESEAPTAQAAATANAQRMTRLNAALRQAGIPERSIRTISYELRPEYARDDRGQAARIVAYRAVNMVQVTVDSVPRIGGIIDSAIGNGANRVANIHFQLRDPHSAHIEASTIAVRNARRQAEALAEAAGERLGPALNISTGGYSPPPPPMPGMAYARAEMMQDVSTPIEGGTLTVQAHVSIVYRLLDQ
ncbi:hypothetical protein BH23GEM9_BH23GEM9_02510 [soil metagenome]